MFDPLADVDLAFEDFPYLDPAFPLGSFPVIIESGGIPLFSDLFIAAGPGAKGTVVICPPMGEGDYLESLIVPLNYAGVNVLVYHPRGTSREKGVAYKMANAIDDAKALLEWFQTVAGPGVDKKGPALRIDAQRVAVCGVGSGANIAMAACAESGIAKGAAAFAPDNIDLLITRQGLRRAHPVYAAKKALTAGEVDIQFWLETMTPSEVKRLSVVSQSPMLSGKPLLMVGARRNNLAPLETHHMPLLHALRSGGASRLTTVELDADELFLNKRYAIARMLIEWLRKECAF